MVEHTTTECAFHPLIHDTFDKCWDLPPDLAGVKTKVTDLPIAKWLKHPARGMLWVAIIERPTDQYVTQPYMGHVSLLIPF